MERQTHVFYFQVWKWTEIPTILYRSM